MGKTLTWNLAGWGKKNNASAICSNQNAGNSLKYARIASLLCVAHLFNAKRLGTGKNSRGMRKLIEDGGTGGKRETAETQLA